MRDSLEKKGFGANLILHEADYKEFLEICHNPNMTDNIKFGKLLTKHGVSTTDQDELWREAKNIFEGLNGDIKTKKAELDKYRGKAEVLIKAEIAPLYVQSYYISESIRSVDINTKLDATRVGTLYGIGRISFGDDVWELTQFVATNFRFGPYDNRLKGEAAYKSWKSRFSIVFGIATTKDIEYKGQSLLDTRLGFKPILGVSYEPVKHVNIMVSSVSFLQETLSTSHSYSLTKARPMLSIAFDFNAFNYLINK